MQTSRSDRFHPSRRRSLAGIAAIAAASALALGACGSSSKTATTPKTAAPSGTTASAAIGAPETSSINVPLVASSAAEGFYVYAAKEGIYQKYGLTVTAPNSDAGQLKTAFIAGNAQIAELSGSDLLNVYSKGLQVQVIGCNASAPASSPAAFQIYADTGIASPADLKGKSIGTTSLGSTHEIAIETFLAKYGLKPTDVTFVPLGSVPNILAALQSGRIDAGALSYPFSSAASKDTKLHDLGGAPAPDIETVVNASWAKKNPNTIEAFLEGNLEGLAAYSTQEAKALPVLAAFLGDDMSNPTQAASVKAGYELYQPPNTAPISTCTSSVLDSILPYLPAADQAAAHKAAGIFDNSYLDKLQANGFYSKLRSQYGSVPGFPAS